MDDVHKQGEKPIGLESESSSVLRALTFKPLSAHMN